jgi:hypothetical protein
MATAWIVPSLDEKNSSVLDDDCTHANQWLLRVFPLHHPDSLSRLPKPPAKPGVG